MSPTGSQNIEPCVRAPMTRLALPPSSALTTSRSIRISIFFAKTPLPHPIPLFLSRNHPPPFLLSPSSGSKSGGKTGWEVRSLEFGFHFSLKTQVDEDIME
ncbi:unnamed protein product [Larinioides sclopetarius]|uniref:Uncharacterized protein n=1 Tax=Larinioides sclopetarius TaxID=280406 RepID=A0AAV1ZMM5_9ARAC